MWEKLDLRMCECSSFGFPEWLETLRACSWMWTLNQVSLLVLKLFPVKKTKRKMVE